jgi:hypothetical protein
LKYVKSSSQGACGALWTLAADDFPLAGSYMENEPCKADTPTDAAKLKHLLRKAAARTVQGLCAAIGELLSAYTTDECASYFKNSGYAPN